MNGLLLDTAGQLPGSLCLYITRCVSSRPWRVMGRVPSRPPFPQHSPFITHTFPMVAPGTPTEFTIRPIRFSQTFEACFCWETLAALIVRAAHMQLVAALRAACLQCVIMPFHALAALQTPAIHLGRDCCGAKVTWPPCCAGRSGRCQRRRHSSGPAGPHPHHTGQQGLTGAPKVGSALGSNALTSTLHAHAPFSAPPTARQPAVSCNRTSSCVTAATDQCCNGTRHDRHAPSTLIPGHACPPSSLLARGRLLPTSRRALCAADAACGAASCAPACCWRSMCTLGAVMPPPWYAMPKDGALCRAQSSTLTCMPACSRCCCCCCCSHASRWRAALAAPPPSPRSPAAPAAASAVAHANITPASGGAGPPPAASACRNMRHAVSLAAQPPSLLPPRPLLLLCGCCSASAMLRARQARMMDSPTPEMLMATPATKTASARGTMP